MDPSTHIEVSSPLMVTDTSTDDVATSEPSIPIPELRERDTRIVFVTVGCAGIIGNAFVILVILLTPKLLKRTANKFIFNQSIVDMLAAINLIGVHAPLINGHLDYSGLNGFLLCKFIGGQSILWSLLTVSTYNMLSLTAERYLQIVFPLVHKVRMTNTVAYIVIGLVWACGMAYHLALAAPTADASDGNCYILAAWPNEETQLAVGIINLNVMFLFPLFCIVYMYGHVGWVLHRRSRIHSHVNAGRSESKQNTIMNRAQRSLVRTVCLVTACFIICWSANEINFLLNLCGYGLSFTSSFHSSSVVMVFVNCCINPLLYSAQYLEFQKAVAGLFCGKNKALIESSSKT